MSTPRTCPKCASGDLKRRSTTYPLMLPDRQINVARVKVHECSNCGHLMPTAEGEAKLGRCLEALSNMLGEMLRDGKI